MDKIFNSTDTQQNTEMTAERKRKVAEMKASLMEPDYAHNDFNKNTVIGFLENSINIKEINRDNVNYIINQICAFYSDFKNIDFYILSLYKLKQALDDVKEADISKYMSAIKKLELDIQQALSIEDKAICIRKDISNYIDINRFTVQQVQDTPVEVTSRLPVQDKDIEVQSSKCETDDSYLDAPSSNIFKAYKEQVLNVKTNSTAIKISGNSSNIVDLGILCDKGKTLVYEWLTKLSEDSLILDISVYRDDMGEHINKLNETKPIIKTEFSEIVITPHGDFDSITTLEYTEDVTAELDTEIDRCSKLQNKRDEVDKEIEEYVNRVTKEFDKFKRKIKTIANKSIDIHKQRGEHTLFIGTAFIRGNINSKTKVNAPLVLIPININKVTNTEIEISIDIDRDIVLNKPLLLLLESNGIIVNKNINADVATYVIKQGITEIKSKVFSNDISVACENSDNSIFDRIYTSTKDTENKLRKLTIYNAIGLGIYSISTSIYDDFTKLEKKRSNKIIDRMLIGDVRETHSERQYIQNPVYKTPDLKIISSLDSSQECAVYAASRTNGLVIYGPPGTGKSQVITNIIADYIANGKRVLMVSEKQTALDVVYKRLKQINKFAIKISDSGDIRGFRDKLEETEGEILYGSASSVSNLDKTCTSIDENLGKLDELEQTLGNKIGNTDKTLSFLYQNSKYSDKTSSLALLIKNKYSELYELTYEQIVEKLDKLNNTINLKCYRLLQNPVIISILNLDEITLHEVINNIVKCEGLLPRLNSIKAEEDSEQEELDRIIDRQYLVEDIRKILIALDIKHSDNADISVDFDNVDLQKLLNICSEYSKLLSIYKYAVTLEELDKNIDLITLQKYKEAYDRRNRLQKIIETYSLDGIASVTSSDITVDIYDNSIIELIETLNSYLTEYTKITDIIKAGVNIRDNNSIMQYINYLNSVELNNIQQILNTYSRSSYSNIILKITDEEYRNYMSSISELQYQKSKIFKNFEKANQNNYSILISMNKYLNDKMQQSLTEIVDIAKEIINLEDKILYHYKNNSVSFNDTIAKDLLGYIAYIIKSEIINIETNIASYREITYNETKDYIVNRDEQLDDIRNKLFSLCGTEFSVLLHKLEGYISRLVAKKSEKQLKLDRLHEEKHEIEHLKRELTGLIKAVTVESLIDNYEIILEYEKYYVEVHEVYNLGICSSYILQLLCDEYTKSEIVDAYCRYNIATYGGNVNGHIRNYKELTNKINNLEIVKTDETIKEIERVNTDIVKDIIQNSSVSIHKILGDLKKKRKGKSIRQIIDEYGKDIIPLYRVWMMTPTTVSDLLPLEEGMFDLVIFDEASQMFLYNGLPSLYRAKRAVVAGDDKQLKPTSFFSTEVGSDEANNLLDDTTGKDTSLLDQAKINFSSITLTFHYRAKYAELIQYSNYAFYNGKLKLAPNVIRKSKDNRPVEFINVHGNRVDSTNVEEAKKVVEILKHILANTNDTVGVITLNAKQKDCIQEVIDTHCSEDSKFDANVQRALNRVEDNEDVGLFIKPIEEVQGDERDIIIISLGLGVNESGKVPLSQLGPIGKDGGANRLNVMISRAKKKEYIVTSVDATDLNIRDTSSEGARIFREFLEYSKSVSELNYDAVEHILGCSSVHDTHFDSPFEEQVYLELTKLGYKVETQVGVRGYKIDLAVYDEVSGQYIAGIECDGATYHSSKSARERDITRQRFLESRGWNILRIWSRNWWKDSQTEVRRIDNELQKLIEKIQNKSVIEQQEIAELEKKREQELEEERIKKIEIEEQQKIQEDKLMEMKKQQEETVRETDLEGCLDIDLLSTKESDVKGYRLEAIIIDDRIMMASKWYEILEQVIKSIARADGVSYGDIQKNIPKSRFIYVSSGECAKPRALDNNEEFFIDTKQPAYGFISKAQKVLLQSKGSHIVKIRINQSTKYERKGSK